MWWWWGGLPEAPPPPDSGALERGGMSAGRRGWKWGTKSGSWGEGGFKMDLCKRRRLQCERGVVHSGKSLSHAISVELQHGAKRLKKVATCLVNNDPIGEGG